MSVPEGYAVAPSSDDHLLKFAVPIPGRDPVLVSMPPRKWMDPAEIKKYQDWITPFGEADVKIAEWANSLNSAEKTLPRPVDAEETLKGFEEKEVTLRWLKPYVSAAEYKLLMTKIPEGTIQWIKKQLEDPDITVGESSASADS
ncbi:hypothetical protein [Gordonia westfalica]|uniref:Uncharacterized protein n=3 Tax=Gordonia westfalica TaxID=158898 RepID=A0A1H2DQC8_9ACTN|nr:hypothetical protein [Gordonia westfalica]SDT83750.1 hypothetical protein SAMN04488548_10212 [Gordonia westfalica]SDT84800.1 hypothetical protein SAMN04488548_11114 [Gordonia westfalica]SDT84814.1 hypothetical protein SAMN04488548_11118 [Gordonia westfalica]SDT85102.1 hypothetical protein SAMN04488548_11516 [Gordonia westfalica]SDT88283.1 hypothetical protein SAMN04488548_1262 [Gordonia westfalica]